MSGIGGILLDEGHEANAMKILRRASRPYDKDRDGFVLGEGAGAVVLESLDHAVARGAKIYCEIGGGGLTADAYHLTAPHPDGLGVIRVMEFAMEDADMQPQEIDYINTHGTSTPLGDVAELTAIQKGLWQPYI